MENSFSFATYLVLEAVFAGDIKSLSRIRKVIPTLAFSPSGGKDISPHGVVQQG